MFKYFTGFRFKSQATTTKLKNVKTLTYVATFMRTDAEWPVCCNIWSLFLYSAQNVNPAKPLRGV